MKIKVICFDGKEIELYVLSFEFRSNQVTNWLKVKFDDGTEDVVRDVCVIRTIR